MSLFPLVNERRVVDTSAFFGVSHKIIDNIVCCPQLPDLFLHCIFKHIFLLGDEGPLLFIVSNALTVPLCPVTAPPLAPCMLARCSAIGTSVDAFFPGSSTLSTCSKAAAFMADCSENTAATKDAKGDFNGQNEG